MPTHQNLLSSSSMGGEKVCSSCKFPKQVSDFSTRTVVGEKYPMSVCRSCDVLRPKQEKKESWTRRSRERMLRESRDRRGGVDRDKWIVQDAQKSDKKYGRENDLSREFVQDLIRNGCAYCGADKGKVKMTLDRIDNGKGHLKTNVVPACLSCNIMRGTFPYEAWLIVAKAIRHVRSEGLLDGWECRRR